MDNKQFDKKRIVEPLTFPKDRMFSHYCLVNNLNLSIKSEMMFLAVITQTNKKIVSGAYYIEGGNLWSCWKYEKGKFYFFHVYSDFGGNRTDRDWSLLSDSYQRDDSIANALNQCLELFLNSKKSVVDQLMYKMGYGNES
jgi:hypothetical protein